MSKRSVIISTGSYLPERIMTNADLEKIVDTSDEWITKRTGIKERRIAADHETTSFMAIKAAEKAMEAGNFKPEDIDTIIVATTTPDNTFPAVAATVQSKLGIPVCPAFDVQAVCSGFVYALSVADSFILSGKSSRILVIGAEKMSSILDWEDRVTCVLFGDGAGAVVVEADDTAQGTADDRGILSTHLCANGDLKDILYVNGGPSTTADSGFIVMEGREVFRHAVEYMADIVQVTLDHNKISASDIDWLIPHQANTRIIAATAKKLDLPMEQVVLTVDKHGNTSAASIPLALDEAVRSGKVERGQLLLLEALGGGLTWGAVLLRF